MIRVAHPLALALLLLVPAAIALARRAQLRGALAWTAAVRALVLTLLIVALAGVQVSLPARETAVAFLVDVSDSIDPGARQRASGFVEDAVRAMRPGDRAGLVTFAATAAVESAPSPTPSLTQTARPDPLDTDIGGAIEQALGLFPERVGKRIVLLSDGNEHRGDAVAAARLAAAQGVEISVAPLEVPERPEVLVEALAAPAEVGAGEVVALRATIASTVQTGVSVRLRRAGAVIDARRVNLRPGRSVVSFGQRLARPGLARYEVEVEADADTIRENNRAEALVVVAGPPRVLYVGDAPGALLAFLRQGAVGIERIAPARLPGRAVDLLAYQSVVLDDVPATALSPAQMRALRDYVGELGGGLVAVGGLHAFGVGGYANTPLEDALPVSADVRHRVALPSMALILVLDASGSMASFGGDLAKVELAKETARSVVDLLGDRDVIGVIAFDQQARWLVEPTEAGNREAIVDQVSRLTAGGGTNLYPALAEARRALRGSRAKVRHVIVLSDGQTDPGDFEGLVSRMARERITVSSVAIGKDADQALMRSISRWGGGRSYYTRDLYTIPQIFTAEALIASRTFLIEEPFAPEVVGDGPMLEGVAALPRLRGYVAASPKPAADVQVQSKQRDPILATWQYGLGRAAAFLSDDRPRWAVDWIRDATAARLLTQTVRWTWRRDREEFDVSTSLVGRTATIVLDARAADGEPIDGLDAAARVTGAARGERVTLVQTAAGWYQGEVGLPEAGAYAVTVTASAGGRLVGSRTVPLVLSYSPELRDLTVNTRLLARLAEITGGRVLARPAQAFAPSPSAARSPRDLWRELGGLALALFVGEIALRRLPAIGYGLALAAGWVRRRLRGPEPAAEERAEDRAYDEADRWTLVTGRDEGGAASMEHAARLYIARLKQTRENRDRE